MKKLLMVLFVLGTQVAFAKGESRLEDLKAFEMNYFGDRVEKAGSELIVTKRLEATKSYFEGTNGDLEMEKVYSGSTILDLVTSAEPKCSLLSYISAYDRAVRVSFGAPAAPVPANMRLIVTSIERSLIKVDNLSTPTIEITLQNAPKYKKMRMTLVCANAEGARLDTLFGTIDDALAMDPDPAYEPTKLCVMGWAPLGGVCEKK